MQASRIVALVTGGASGLGKATVEGIVRWGRALVADCPPAAARACRALSTRKWEAESACTFPQTLQAKDVERAIAELDAWWSQRGGELRTSASP